MYPELFEIPFTHLTVKSYGLMMVIGFLTAVSIIRRLSRRITPNPQLITNAALYSLIAGVVGARLFYVVHYLDKFRENPLSDFAFWQGGLELLGGVLLAITVIILYMRDHKLPIRRYLDILAIGLMAALAFGRIGCFLNGCCFGKPTQVPWAVCFPYGSPAYQSQVESNLQRNRPEPQLELPADFFGYVQRDGLWYSALKPYEDLTSEQKFVVEKGPFQCLPVHPTQLYSSANGAVLCLILYLLWRKSRKINQTRKTSSLLKPGGTFGLMFVLYGVTRFFMEFVRDDNPFEFDSLTVSQNISVVMVVLGVALMAAFSRARPDNIPPETLQ